MLNKIKKHTKSLNIFVVIFAISIIGMTVFAVGRVQPYDSGETLDPDCNPGESNCTVELKTERFLEGIENYKMDVGYKFWTYNKTNSVHFWYSKGENFRNCKMITYIQRGETTQNTVIDSMMTENLGSDRTNWNSHPKHTLFLRDFVLNPDCCNDENHPSYGHWALIKYGPSRLYKCQVDKGTGKEINMIAF